MASPPATLNKANTCFFAVSFRIPVPTANPRKIIPRISSARTALRDSGIGRKPNTSERRDSFMCVYCLKHAYKTTTKTRMYNEYNFAIHVSVWFTFLIFEHVLIHHANMSVKCTLSYTPLLYRKMGFTGVYISFLCFALKHRLLVLVRTASLKQK